jgi:hypothetical protein
VQYIIFSSDSKGAIQEATEFSTKQGNWTFIFNPMDRTGRQNGGWRSQDSAQAVADALQSMTSLHLLLRGKWFLLNGASHWHTLIALLVKHGGCSLVRKPQVLMLDEQFGKYKICAFEKNRNSSECRANRPERLVRMFLK